MINLSIFRRFIALLTLAFFFSSAFAVPVTTAIVSPPALSTSADLFKSRIDGCNAVALPINLLLDDGKDKLAARMASPMCTYLERCCSGNTDNSLKCCDGLRKNC